MFSTPPEGEDLTQSATNLASIQELDDWCDRIDLYPISIAIFVLILGLSWIFVTFIGGVINNYRGGWRSAIVRKVIDFINRDKVITYISRAEAQDLCQSLLHSGMISTDRQELIYIDSDDSIAMTSAAKLSVMMLDVKYSKECFVKYYCQIQMSWGKCW